MPETLANLCCAAMGEVADRRIPDLHTQLSANSHLFRNLVTREELLLSLYLRLMHVPSLSALVSSLRERLPTNQIIPIQPLPDLSHPNQLASITVEEDVQGYAFSLDGNTLFVLARSIPGKNGRHIALYDTCSGRRLASHQVSNLENKVAAWFDVSCNNVLATCWDNNKLALWRIPSFELLGYIDLPQLPASQIDQLAFTTDGKQLITLNSTTHLAAIDVASMQLLWTTPIPGNPQHFSISPTGSWVLTHGWEDLFKVWELKSGKEIASFGEKSTGWTASLSPEGSTLHRFFTHTSIYTRLRQEHWRKLFNSQRISVLLNSDLITSIL